MRTMSGAKIGVWGTSLAAERDQGGATRTIEQVVRLTLGAADPYR
jgi:hypothetical protein